MTDAERAIDSTVCYLVAKTPAEIAEESGVAPAEVNRILAEWTVRGIVETRDGVYIYPSAAVAVPKEGLHG